MCAGVSELAILAVVREMRGVRVGHPGRPVHLARNDNESQTGAWRRGSSGHLGRSLVVDVNVSLPLSASHIIY